MRPQVAEVGDTGGHRKSVVRSLQGCPRQKSLQVICGPRVPLLRAESQVPHTPVCGTQPGWSVCSHTCSCPGLSTVSVNEDPPCPDSLSATPGSIPPGSCLHSGSQRRRPLGVAANFHVLTTYLWPQFHPGTRTRLIQAKGGYPSLHHRLPGVKGAGLKADLRYAGRYPHINSTDGEALPGTREWGAENRGAAGGSGGTEEGVRGRWVRREARGGGTGACGTGCRGQQREKAVPEVGSHNAVLKFGGACSNPKQVGKPRCGQEETRQGQIFEGQPWAAASE
nr:PREDICTED: uncharacterized protein LOC109460892 [Rhinolophus sinicus]